MELFIIFLMSYVIGSIPTAYIIGKINDIDIRKYGSGNVGAANIYRVLGKKWGTITFMFDFLKGFIPTYTASKIFNNPYITIGVGFLSIVGHIFTLFLSFKGGKGVATSTGVFMAITPYTLIISIIVFFLITKVSGFVSLGTLIATFIFMLTSIFIHIKIEFKIFITVVSIIIFITHIPNIKRLLKSKELKYNNK